MVAWRLSRAAWERECESVREWLASSPAKISKAESDEMLSKIAEPLKPTDYPFVIIHCYADIPAKTRWDTVFSPNDINRIETTNATFQFGIFLSRYVVKSLDHGHHQIALLAFPDRLPALLETLPVDQAGEFTGYVGLCASDDLAEIRHALAHTTQSPASAKSV